MIIAMLEPQTILHVFLLLAGALVIISVGLLILSWLTLRMAREYLRSLRPRVPTIDHNGRPYRERL
jgi:hypothetical protein